MMLWVLEHRVFAYESYVKNNESVTAVKRKFRHHFNIHRNQSVPTHKTIVRWVNTVCLRGTQLDRKPVGAQRTARTPENVERVRLSALRSPNRSARRHSIELGFSNRSIRRILHEDPRFHPYKFVVQQLKPGEYAQRLNFAGQIKVIFEVNDNSILLMRDEAHFRLSGESTELVLFGC